MWYASHSAMADAVTFAPGVLTCDTHLWIASQMLAEGIYSVVR